MKKISIKINSKDIVIVEVNKVGNSVTVLHTVRTATPEQCFDNGTIKNVSIMAKVLSEALKANKINTKDVNFVISSSAVISRTVKLPYVEDKSDAIAMIRNELDQIMPVDLSKHGFVYTVVNTFSENNVKKAEYLAHGLPMDMVNGYINLAEQLGLRISNIDMSFNELTPITVNDLLVNNKPSAKSKTVGYIDFDNDLSTFSIYKKGANDFSRPITKTYKNFEKELSTIAGSSVGKVKRCIENFDVLEDYSEITDREDKAIYDALKANIEEFAEEINRYIKYYNSKNTQEPLDRIVVYGVYAGFKNLDKYLTEEFLLETDIVETLTGVNTKGSIANGLREYFDVILAGFIGKERLNFYSGKTAAHNKGFRTLIVGMTVGLIAVLGLAFIGYSAYTELSQLKSEIGRMKSFVNNPNNATIEAETAKLKAELDLLKGQETLLLTSNVKNTISDVVTTEKYTDLEENIPTNCLIKSISIGAANGNKPGSIYFQGIAGNTNGVAQFVKNLKGLEYVNDAFCTTITKDEEGYTFVIICEVKEVVDNEN